jgi:hypothetical protein
MPQPSKVKRRENQNADDDYAVTRPIEQTISDHQPVLDFFVGSVVCQIGTVLRDT